MSAKSIPRASALLLLSGAVWVWFLQPPCVVRNATGLKCPACGVSHALRAVLEGHWREVIYWHALLVPGLLLLAVGCVRPLRWPWWVAAGGILLFFTVLRNLPVYLLY